MTSTEHDDPTGRALAVLSCLTSRRSWSGDELAARLGVTTRTVRRDVERLRRLGYDIASTGGTDGGYRLGSTAAVPPLFLDADEAIAVVTALIAAAGNQQTGMPDASSRALAKLHHVLPTAVRSRAQAVQGVAQAAAIGRAPAVTPEVLADLAESCRDTMAVRFAYVDRTGRPSARRVEPHALLTVRGAWYVVGFDLDRRDWRVFRADRIDGDVEQTGHRAPPRTIPGGDAMAYLAGSLASMPTAHRITVELPVAPDDALARLPWLNPRRVEQTGRRRCRLQLGADDLGELTRQLVDVVAAAPPTSASAGPAVSAHLADLGEALTRLAGLSTG